MNKITTKGWLTIAIVVVIIFLLWMYFKNKNTVTTTTTTNIPRPNLNTNTNTIVQSGFPLKFGSSGDNVKIYQMYLNSLGSTLKVDGKWGTLTGAASLSKTGLTSVTEDYFYSTVNPFRDTVGSYLAYIKTV